MKLKGRAFWLDMIAKQRKWIEDHGGCLSGYIARYGDPGVPPLDAKGDYKKIKVPISECHLFNDLTPIVTFDIEFNHYYARHYGDGGTAIYNADMAALRRLEAKVR